MSILVFEIILKRKKKLVALLLLSDRCVTINRLWLFLTVPPTVPWVGLQCVIVVFPDHTHLLSDVWANSVNPETSLVLHCNVWLFRELVALLCILAVVWLLEFHMHLFLAVPWACSGLVYDCSISWSFPINHHFIDSLTVGQ